MPYICLPAYGDCPAMATLVRWRATAGDYFVPGQALAEFESESGYLIVEAAEAGRLSEVLVQPGQTVATGARLASIDTLGPLHVSCTAVTSEPTAVTDATVASESRNVIPILMPQAGNTMEEGTVVAWLVKEGDQVSSGQVICEIETDKATMDFESPDSGRLARIVANLDEPVAVKSIIAVLADSDEDADAYLVSQGGAPVPTVTVHRVTTIPVTRNGPNQNVSMAPILVTTEGRIKASPAARKLVAERGIPLATVGRGRGPGGRILSSDVADVNVPAGFTAGVEGEIRRPLSKMRRAIGLNLQQSKQTVPHFYVRTTVNADSLLSFYREQKTAAACTLNDIIMLAVGRAIREFPAVRSQIIGNEIVEYLHANIGIAVAIEDGLVVPVVLAVDTLSLGQLAAETKRIVELARTGRLENVGKGHFTISNLGMFGVDEFSAIINPPESGILAVSAAREAVIVENGAMRVGHQMTMTLSADHRVVDGVMAAKFVQRLRAILEDPSNELA